MTKISIQPLVRRITIGGLVALSTLFVIAQSSPALAHILKIFAEVSGSMIIGQGYFSTGTFPVHLPVEVFGPGRQKVGEVTTDEHGKFSFQPMKRQNYTFVIDAGEGHHAEWTVEADELPTTLSAR
jgi:nickel transport protein